MISPFILGSGRAGNAAAKSLACLQSMEPEWEIANPVWLRRNQPIQEALNGAKNPIVIISNPPGLHTRAILEADRAGAKAILCEKPSCTTLEEVESLKNISTPTGIFHVYRQMWGLQTLKEMLDRGDLGELICLEGRYWQASTAERALQNPGQISNSWKNDPKLTGSSDALLDVGTHWIDAACFLLGGAPQQIRAWKSFKNSETPHRDSHVQLGLDFSAGGRASVSISKTVHGATNHFEMNLIGTLKSATWTFLNPDEIFMGAGRDRSVVTRKTALTGSFQPPHHGMGWLEGYIEIHRRVFNQVFKNKKESFPTLVENLKMMESIFKTIVS